MIIRSLHHFFSVKRLIPGLILALSAVFIVTTPVFAQACEDRVCEKKDDDEGDQQYLLCLSEKKICLEAKIDDAKQQKNTLGSTIAILSGKVNLQELKISQTKAEINQLEKEIDELDLRISGLDLSLDRLTSLLVERVRAQYKETRVSPFTALASTGSFSNMFAREQYVNLASQQTATAMERAELQKMVYDQEKDLKSQKQAEVEGKRQQLENPHQSKTGTAVLTPDYKQ